MSSKLTGQLINLTTHEVTLVKDNLIYTISYSVETDWYSLSLPGLMTILDTLRLDPVQEASWPEVRALDETIQDKPLKPDDFSLYTNSSENISILYPAYFTMDESWKRTHLTAAFIIPNEGTSDTYSRSGLFLYVVYRPSPVKLDEFLNSSLEDIANSKEDFSLLYMNRTSFAGLSAIEASFTITDELHPIKSLIIMTNRENKVYCFEYDEEIDKYYQYLDTARQMIASFQFRA